MNLSLAPTSVNLSALQRQQFTATVQGNSNSAVTWFISPPVGTVSSSGLYSAPASIASTETVTLTATSQADPTKFQSAAIVLTAANTGIQAQFQLNGTSSELSGLSNGSVIIPTQSPTSLTGSVVVNGQGAVNIVSGPAGGPGVYFSKCCDGTDNAYYKFAGSGVGKIFDTPQGQISFYLRSRYSFANRQASATQGRFAFDVRDNNPNNHLFYFLSQPSSGNLVFSYRAGSSSSQFYYVPQGTEDSLFGNSVSLKVTITWDGSKNQLFLNDKLVQTASYTPVTPVWSNASNFDFGAYEYLSYGGYNVSDDILSAFTVTHSLPSTPPSISVTAPAIGATLSGLATINANATDAIGIATVQFQVDGVNFGNPLPGPGPAFSASWDTTTAGNGMHTITAVATNKGGISTTSPALSTTVSNQVVLPVISSVQATALSPTSATLVWSTDQPTDSQVSYSAGTGSLVNSPLQTALSTSHSVVLTALSPATSYSYRVLSRNAQQLLATSGSFSFSTLTNSAPQVLFQLHADSSEVTGLSSGSIVTPAIAPAGFKGKVIVTNGGSVNFTPAQSGNGVYFLNCCDGTANAYYKFTGASIGTLFNQNQGQVSFYLKSRYSFAQRMAVATGARFAFDVHDDDPTNHLFYFITQPNSGSLVFSYRAGSSSTTQFYYAPQGTEEALYGNGVILKVTISWDGSTNKLYFNDKLVQTAAYSKSNANWTAGSNFDLGAYEYLSYGGYNSSDDVIDEFTISPVPAQ